MKAFCKTLYIWLGITGAIFLGVQARAECPGQVIVHAQTQVRDTSAEAHRTFREVMDALPVITANGSEKIIAEFPLPEVSRWSKKPQTFTGLTVTTRDTSFYTLTPRASRIIRGIDILLGIHCLII